jgi:hypothetical protein
MEAFLHNGKAQVKGKDRWIDRLVFEDLTRKIRRYHYRREANCRGPGFGTLETTTRFRVLSPFI